MMTKLRFLPLVFSVLVALSANAGEPSRFIVVGFDVDGLKGDVAAERGRVLQDLRYHRGFVAEMSAVAADKLQRKHGAFALIEEDGVVSTKAKPGVAPTQPAQSLPWGVRETRAPEAFAQSRGAGVTVCVVDTGIQGNHPDLSSNVVGGENFVVKKGWVNPSAWGDDHGHGTHVAGTIAALDNDIGVVGVAPEAKLFAAKVLDFRGSGYMSAVADGIRSCMRNGARVINMSLGSSADSLLVRSAVLDASVSGVVLVAAAGNEQTDVSNSYPAAYAEVIAVSAVDSNFQFAYFSNFGSKIRFSAPGVGVYSTTKGSTYTTMNGTSMASPHVAGVAALAISAGSLGMLGDDIGLDPTRQGSEGFIDALRSVQNQPL